MILQLMSLPREYICFLHIIVFCRILYSELKLKLDSSCVWVAIASLQLQAHRDFTRASLLETLPHHVNT
jgi:hypothetical protein